MSVCVFVKDPMTKRKTIETGNLVYTIPSTKSKLFFEKMTLMASRLEKLQYQVNSRILSRDLLVFFHLFLA